MMIADLTRVKDLFGSESLESVGDGLRLFSSLDPSLEDILYMLPQADQVDSFDDLCQSAPAWKYSKRILLHVLCQLAKRQVAWAVNLEELTISRGELETLPEEIRHLGNLNRLIVPNNRLITLPDALGKLPLETLHLAANRFEEFPGVVLKLRGLKELSVYENAIRSLPVAISELPELEEVRATHCQYTLEWVEAMVRAKIAFRLSLTPLLPFGSQELVDSMPQGRNNLVATSVSVSLQYRRSSADPFFRVARVYFWREDIALTVDEHCCGKELKSWHIPVESLRELTSFADLQRLARIEESWDVECD